MATALCAVQASAIPSALPGAGGIRPAAGAPYVMFPVLVSELPEWRAEYESLEREFRERATAMTAARLANRKAYEDFRDLQFVRSGDPRYTEYTQARDVVMAQARREQELALAYAKRENEQLNPMVPALLADIQEFARENSYESVPIMQPHYLTVLQQTGMKDVTADFVAWRAAKRG